MQTVRAADTNEVVKLIFRESDNDRKVMLQLEKKLFDYFNQEVFRDDNGTAVSSAVGRVSLSFPLLAPPVASALPGPCSPGAVTAQGSAPEPSPSCHFSAGPILLHPCLLLTPPQAEVTLKTGSEVTLDAKSLFSSLSI